MFSAAFSVCVLFYRELKNNKGIDVISTQMYIHFQATLPTQSANQFSTSRTLTDSITAKFLPKYLLRNGTIL
jgi:hypothetical protein